MLLTQYVAVDAFLAAVVNIPVPVADPRLWLKMSLPMVFYAMQVDYLSKWVSLLSLNIHITSNHYFQPLQTSTITVLDFLLAWNEMTDVFLFG